MSTPPSPWSDPTTPTEPGDPYPGRPATAPPSWGPPAGISSGWPVYAPHGHPWAAGPYGVPWLPGPAAPRRPGQLVAAAVLAFVQAAVVALASAYVFLLGSLVALAAGEPGFPADGQALATEATVVAAVQVGSVVALVVGGVVALNRRTPAARWMLVAALGLQLVLAGYWAVRLLVLLDDAVGPDPSAALLPGVLCFATAPAVALGLAVSRSVREWSTGDPGAGAAPSR
ncbi:hypothetical protein DQ238_21840 [Geodermatophilus sp. TF02-6]|uniref:hypothetical protein n=1 Tax=Geodermatophilus sp. TF02-6 TaxID=2250575 RepID=UPI000DEB6DB4|nr:hypothetical protein [Geodermatophilus sp. TF02-6]RBY74484.1 hypothetical protein DQ238_21840 [Geodermatophilus sp. TF02-6]